MIFVFDSPSILFNSRLNFIKKKKQIAQVYIYCMCETPLRFAKVKACRWKEKVCDVDREKRASRYNA